MATIEENLQTLQDAKVAIKIAIEEKGQDLTDVPFTGYAAKITEIETGGGGENKLPQILDGSVVEITAEDFAGITAIRNSAFSGCNKLESVELPNTITSIGNSAFNNCDILPSIEIPASVSTIGSYAFQYCKSFTSIEIPDTVKSLGAYMLAYCDNLESAVIGNGVGQLPAHLFYYSRKLKNVVVGSGITYVYTGVFRDCVAMEKFTIYTEKPPYMEGNFGLNKTCVICVPAQSLEKYKSATNWANYADQMVAIEE